MGEVSKDPWQEPVRGQTADLSVLTLPGRAQVLAIQDGRLPLPPNARLTGRRILEVGQAGVTFGMPLSPWLQGPKGRIHPGVLVLLGDSALTAAVLTALPAGVVFSTAELSMTFLGEMPAPGGELRAVATALHIEPRHGLAVADLFGPSGERLGFGTARVFLQPPIDVSGLPPFSSAPPEAAWPTPDPWARELVEETPKLVGHGLLDLDATRVGGRPRPPIDRLIGIRLVEVGEGEVTFTMRASPWLGNELGTVSGGMLGLLAHSATSAAGQSVARAGSPYRALDVKVNFLEQVDPDGEPVSATGRAIHRGKLVVANTEVTHGGRLVATATGSTVLGS